MSTNPPYLKRTCVQFQSYHRRRLPRPPTDHRSVSHSLSPRCSLPSSMARQQQPSTAAAADHDPKASRSPPRVSTSATERVVNSIETAPLVFIGVGSSLAVVGSVPLVVTMSLGVNSSATIIGVGFVGFGFLIIVPGLCWCLVSNALAQCHRRGLALPGTRRRRHRHARTLSTEQEVELLVLRYN